MEAPKAPTFAMASRFWLKLGLVSFGGPAGQIALMHEELVVRRQWMSEPQFFRALNFCMLLPGPEAQQLATYSGWKLHGIRGGLVAGGLFVLPSAVLLWALSWLYASSGTLPVVAAFFYGLKPAVLAIVAGAVVRLGGRVLKNAASWMVALLAFAALQWTALPFPLIVLGAGALGWAGARLWPELVSAGDAAAPAREGESDSGPKPGFGRALRVLGLGLGMWWAPLLVLGLWLGTGSTLFQEGLFFSKASMVTFGGAYAVLPYVSQQAVTHYGWLSAGQMLDGLGMAETTPGPLIMVLQFVGFMGAWNEPGPFSPLAAGTLGAAVTTWTTFVPSFIWIFLGAPYLERWQGRSRFQGALAAVTAAVVGVICHLALWFGWRVVQPDAAGGFDWFAALLALGALVGMLRWKWNVVFVVLACAGAGWVARFGFGL